MTNGSPKARLRAAILALAASTAFGASASATTLAEALAVAYESNPDLISARANLRAVDENVTQARSGLRPDVSGSLRFEQTYTDGEVSPFAEQSEQPFNATLDARQPLYDGGQTYNNVRARIAEVSAARARLTALEQQTLLEVVTSYLDVLRDREFVDLAQNNVRVLSEQLRAARDRFEVGEVTRTDVSQAEARRAEAQANLTSARGQLERSRLDFRAVTGLPADGLAPAPALPPLPLSIEEAVDIALANHPEVLAARFEENAAARDVKAAIGGLLPQVDLAGQLAYNDSTVFGDTSTDIGQASVGVVATIPLYQGGAQYSRVRQAQALASEARADITSAARERGRVASAAYTELEVARANIRSVRQQVQAARLAFEGVREEAIVGSRTTLDVLNAEQELLDARTTLVGARRDEYVAAYTLLSAIGALTMAELELPVAAYDPEANYVFNNDRFFGYDESLDTPWERVWRP